MYIVYTLYTLYWPFVVQTQYVHMYVVRKCTVTVYVFVHMRVHTHTVDPQKWMYNHLLCVCTPVYKTVHAVYSYKHVYVVHVCVCRVSEVPQKPPVEIVYVSGRTSPKPAQKSSGMLRFIYFLGCFVFRQFFLFAEKSFSRCSDFCFVAAR